MWKASSIIATFSLINLRSNIWIADIILISNLQIFQSLT